MDYEQTFSVGRNLWSKAPTGYAIILSKNIGKWCFCLWGCCFFLVFNFPPLLKKPQGFIVFSEYLYTAILDGLLLSIDKPLLRNRKREVDMFKAILKTGREMW